jgi:hypothetical protein
MSVRLENANARMVDTLGSVVKVLEGIANDVRYRGDGQLTQTLRQWANTCRWAMSDDGLPPAEGNKKGRLEGRPFNQENG